MGKSGNGVKPDNYLTRGAEFAHTYQRSGTNSKPVRAVKCVSCGRLIPASEAKCPDCGADMTSGEQLAANARAKRSNKWIIAALLLAGLAVMGVTLRLLLTTPSLY